MPLLHLKIHNWLYSLTQWAIFKYREKQLNRKCFDIILKQYIRKTFHTSGPLDQTQLLAEEAKTVAVAG